jgi:hypothetical protein
MLFVWASCEIIFGQVVMACTILHVQCQVFLTYKGPLKVVFTFDNPDDGA